jgi:hypothetical protein
MRKRISRIMVVVGASGVVALSGVAGAQARNGADDPPGQHQEHQGGKHKRHHGKHHNPRGDDKRGGRGQAVEPGDDRGGQGQVEPGDDHGGHGSDDGPNHT